MAKTVYCSFCGKSSDKAGKMMETSDRHDKALIRICRECAEMAIEVIDRVEGRQNPQ